MYRFLLAALIVVCSVRSAAAVIIVGGTSSTNTTAPSNDPDWGDISAVWGNVGEFGGASTVYLGNRWAITARHITNNTGQAVFGGNAYNLVPNSGIFIENPTGQGKTQYTDLMLYRLETDPGLPSLTISASGASLNGEVLAIGRGLNRQATESNWDSSWVETTPNPSTYAGYKWLGTQTMRWGDNIVTSDDVWVNYNVAVATPADVFTFWTTFDATGGTASEFQATTGDSGGAVFIKNGSNWELAGITVNTTIINANQPLSTSVFGNETIIADLSLSAYRNQILATVPEPSSVMLAVIAALGLLWWKRAVSN